MLKVLSVSSLYPHTAAPNFGIFVANRLRAMQATGKVDITLLAPYPSSPVHKFMTRYKGSVNSGPLHEIDEGGFNRYNVPYFSLPKFFKSTELHSLTRWLKKHADQLWRTHGPFDVIDVHWGYPDLPAATFLSERWGIPINMTLRGMETFYPGDEREYVVRRALKQSDGIISLSEQMLKQAQTYDLEPHCLQSIIVNGSDPIKFKFSDAASSRQTLGIPAEQLVLLGIGSLIYRKGFHCVITALAALIKEHPELHYYIIGSEAAEVGFSKKIQTLCFELGISEHVHLIGPVLNKDLNTWYTAADWFVLSSAGEGSPNVLSEALMSGCPSIVTPVGAAPDLMGLSIRSGYQFPPAVLNVFDSDDPESLGLWRSTLQEILAKTPRFSSRERKMLATDMSSFTWKWCAEKTIDHLMKIVNHHD